LDGRFFKNSKNRATRVFEFRTLNEEEEEEEDGTKENNNDRRPPEVQTSIYIILIVG
jgi:hypothetical protein